MVTFVREDPVPSWWANALSRFLSVVAENFQLVQLNDTTVRGVGGADDDAAVIAIDGKWRWRETNTDRAHPGGAAGTYKVWVTAAANAIDNVPNPGTDHTNYAWDLAITAGAAPAAVAGVVDIWREVGYVVWDGAKITQLVQTVDGTRPHAAQHLPGGADPLPDFILNAVVPVGGQIAFAGDVSQIPPNFKAVDGSLIDAAAFPLFDARVGGSAPAASRHRYNGGVDPGGGKVRLPDKRGRSFAGANNMGTAAGAATGNGRIVIAPGATFGEVLHQLNGWEHGDHVHAAQGNLTARNHTHRHVSPIGLNNGRTVIFNPNTGELDSPGSYAVAYIGTPVAWDTGVGTGGVQTEVYYVTSEGASTTIVDGSTAGSSGYGLAPNGHNTVHPVEADLIIVRVA